MGNTWEPSAVKLWKLIAKTATVSLVWIRIDLFSMTSEVVCSARATGMVTVVVWFAVTVKGCDQPTRGMVTVPLVFTCPDMKMSRR